MPNQTATKSRRKTLSSAPKPVRRDTVRYPAPQDYGAEQFQRLFGDRIASDKRAGKEYPLPLDMCLR